MREHRTRLSKDKLRFLEIWMDEKRDHLQEILQHLRDDERLHNYRHAIDPHTHDIFLTGLTLLPLDVAKKVLSECAFFTCYLSNYQPGHFLDKSELGGRHLIVVLFPHGESIPKYWSYLLHEIARYVLGNSGSKAGMEAETRNEAKANELACRWVRESSYNVPRDSFEGCRCPDVTIRFCKALATSV